MNQLPQSEMELKFSAFEKLGDNPTEVDIKYVSYLLKIPLSTLRLWLEEKAEVDFQIDISPAEDKECQIIGCKMIQLKFKIRQIIEQTKTKSQNKTQQNNYLIIIDDEAYQKDQRQKKSDKDKISTSIQNQKDLSEKQQNLQDFVFIKRKKLKNSLQQTEKEIQVEQNKPGNENIKQIEQKQNTNQTNPLKQNLQNHQQISKQQNQDNHFQQINSQQQQQQQNLSLTNQNFTQFSVQPHELLSQQIQSIEKKPSNNQNQNMTQPPQNKDQNSAIDPFKLVQQQPQQQQPNYLALVCSSQSMQAQTGSTNKANQLSPNQTNLSKQTNQEVYHQKQNSIRSELNLIQNQSIQGSASQNNSDQKQQQPNQIEMIQIFNKTSQVLGQATQLITVISNQQVILMDKLDMIYECVNKK